MAIVSEEITRRYDDLIDSYLDIKPVLRDVYERNGKRVDAINNEIRAVNDHLARCYNRGMSEVLIAEELSKADGHMKRMILDCFKQLNVIFYCYINDYEKHHFSRRWLYVDKGKFWTLYTHKRLKITNAVERAKLYESQNLEVAFAAYQEAYSTQEEIYLLLNQYRDYIHRAWWRKVYDVVDSNMGWFVSTVLLTIIPAAIWECWCN